MARRVLVMGAASGIGLGTAEASVVVGVYYGPASFGQMGGTPGPVKPSRRALEADVAARLWEASERLTGVRYEKLSGSV
jgi:NAD(P)-dependent dehydrogenase (short-subunit alcohol dehydrogenase family)